MRLYPVVTYKLVHRRKKGVEGVQSKHARREVWMAKRVRCFS